MTAEEQARLQAYTAEIAKILYRNTPPLGIREPGNHRRAPEKTMDRDSGIPSCFFFIKETTGTDKGRPRTVKSCVGELKITEKQAEQLNLKKSTRLAPVFQKCCLRQVALLSYSKASKEIEVHTGIKIGHTNLHRLVENQEWVEPVPSAPVKETSVDGGKLRIRGPKGKGSHWLDYKAVSLHDSFYAAYFIENEMLIDYVNRQPLNSLLTCLGDGQDGIWNIIGRFNPDGNRREILYWYHLVENLHQVGGSNKRLYRAKKLLWRPCR